MSITYTSVASRGIGRKDYSRAAEPFAIQPELLYFDGFEFLPRSYNDDGSAGYVVSRITDNAWSGGGCLRLFTGNVADNFALYIQRFGIVKTKKILLDAAFSFTTTPGLSVLFRIGRYTGSQLEYGDAIYSITNARWETHAGPITGGSQNLFQDERTFHRIFLAVDFDSDEYLYLRCNDLELGLSGISLFTQADATAPYAFVRIYFYSGALINQILFVDDVRVSELT